MNMQVRHITLLLACVALTAPHQAQAQRAATPVGVVRISADVNPVSADDRLFSGAEEQTDRRLPRIVMGGLIGAISGALVTALIVRHCEAHDDSHGDGPGCGIIIPSIGPAAVLVGGALGVIIADW